MPRLWEYESRPRRLRRRTRAFREEAQTSGFQKLVRDSLVSRGLDPDAMADLSAPPSVTKPVDRDTIRQVVPESGVRSAERSLRPAPPATPNRAPSASEISRYLKENYPGREDSVDVKYVPGEGTYITEKDRTGLIPEEDTDGSSKGFLKGIAGTVAKAAGDVLSTSPVKEALSILDILDIPRREVGKPVARVLLEPLALTVEAADTLSPDNLSALPRILPTGGQIRGATSVEILSFITDPLNLAFFAGPAIKAAKAAALGARLDIKGAQALRKAEPLARRLLAEEAGGRALPSGWKAGAEAGAINRQVGKIRLEGQVFPDYVKVDIVGKGTIADLRQVDREIAQLVADTGKPMRTPVVEDRLLPIMRRSRDYQEIERYVPEGLKDFRKVMERRTGRPITGELGSPQFEMSVESAGRLLGKAPVAKAAPTSKLAKAVPVKESAEVKALRTKVAGEGRNPPPPPPPRLPGEPPPLLPGDVSPSLSEYRTIENGLHLSPRAGNLTRRVGEVVGQFPALKLFMKAVTGPAALARLIPEIRAGVTYQAYMTKLNTALGQRLIGSERAFNKTFTLGKDLSKVVRDGKEVAFGDFAEDVLRSIRTGKPGRFSSTAAEREWIVDHKSLMNQLAEQYKFVSGEDLRLADPDLWPRFVLRDDGKVFIRGKGKVGVKQSPAKERLFLEQEEAIARGTPYATPVETAKVYGQALNKMTLDKIMVQVFKEDKIGQPIIKGLRQQIKALKGQIKAAKPTTEAGRLEVEVLRNKAFNLQAEMAAVKRTLVPAKQVLGPGFGKQLLEPEAAKMIQDIWGPAVGGKAGKVLRGGEWASNMTRFVVTGLMDVGHFFIQGATLLATSPGDWSRAAGHALVSLVSPEHWARFKKTSPAAIKAARYGVGAPDIEFLAITKRFAALGRVPGADIVKAVFGAAPRGFETFIDAGRIFNFNGLASVQEAAVGKAARGLLPTTKRAAAGLSKAELEGELFRIAGYVKTKLGTTDLVGLGLSATQRQVEMSFGLFSPRYTRSIFGTIGWAASNGVPARDAQKAIAGMLFGGAASFYAFGRATGLSHDEVVERLNPMSSRFMALPMGGNEYGFGSAYRSTLAFLGGMLVKDNWNLSATDNPISRYLRSRTAPVTGNLVDFIEGEDFLGKEVNLGAFIDDPARLRDYFQDRFLPLNLEATIEARGPLEMKVLAGLTETVGGRSFPRSSYSIFQEAQESVFQEKRALGEKPYVDFNSFEDLTKENAPATAVINTDPRVQQAQERLEHESRFRKKTTESVGFEKLEETRVEQEQQQLEDDAAFSNDEMAVSVWKDNFRGRQGEFFARRDQIVADFGLKFGKDKAGVNAAIDSYFSVEGEDYKNPMTGGIDWDRFFAARDATLERLSSTNLKLVKEYLRRYDTPTVRTFRKAQSDLEEYWAVEDLVWSRLRENEEFRPYLNLSDYLAAKQQALLDSGVPPDEVSSTLSRLAVVSAVTSTVAKLRNRYRLAHPSADALLVKWYGLSPVETERSRASRLARAQSR